MEFSVFVKINNNSDFSLVLKKIECEHCRQFKFFVKIFTKDRPRGIFQISMLTQVTWTLELTYLLSVHNLRFYQIDSIRFILWHINRKNSWKFFKMKGRRKLYNIFNICILFIIQIPLSITVITMAQNEGTNSKSEALYGYLHIIGTVGLKSLWRRCRTHVFKTFL